MPAPRAPWRVRQVRLSAAGVNWLAGLPPARPVIALARDLPVSRYFFRWWLGYQRAFETLEEAEAAVAPYAFDGHENPANASTHLDLSRAARPSDYAVLYHLQRHLSGIRRIFDLGGNVGNLFYCYSRYLTFSEDLQWQVLDLPANMERGRSVALSRGAHQLSFVNDWTNADGADLLLVSGALHYLRQSLASMISTLDRPPTYVLINRTPITDGPAFATVQDGGDYRVACMIHNRATLIREFESAGYDLKDCWQAAERSLTIPGDPDHSLPSYSGLFFLRR